MLDLAMSSASLMINEPSMEEILASIRRIIADDQEAMGASIPVENSSPLKSVLDLTERHVDAETSTHGNGAAHRALEGASVDLDVSIAGLMHGYELERTPSQPCARNKPAPLKAEVPPHAEGLLSGQASASAADAFGRLNAALPPSSPVSMEDFMREMLRPMLKAWLDDNLPALVERLVQAEIERVTRGRT